MKIVLISILALISIGSYAQELEELKISDHRDNYSQGGKLANGDIVVLLNSHSPNLPNSFELSDIYDSLDDVDSTLSNIGIYSFYNDSWNIESLGFKNDTLMGAGQIYIDRQLPIIYILGWESVDFSTTTPICIIADYDLNFIEKK